MCVPTVQPILTATIPLAGSTTPPSTNIPLPSLQQVNTDGFGDLLNVAVEDFLVFGNDIYVATWGQCVEEK